ncbi:hypothetical protein D9M68_902420 [compost metagenome]
MSTANTSIATITPLPTARIKSRRPRILLDSLRVCAGRKNKASISRTTVTTSTDNWVSAKSGAE